MAQKLSRRHLGQLVAVALVGVGAAQILRKTAPIGHDVSSSEAARALLKDKTSPSREVEQPTLTMAVFTDYQCPACKLANDSMELAVQRDGHVRLVYKDWPVFGPMSEHAARIAIASDRQGIYTKVHSHLMNARGPLDESVLREAVQSNGGSWAQIENELHIHVADIDRQLDRNRRDAFQMGISGTPTYLAGPILVTGAQDAAAFKKIFSFSRKTLNDIQLS